MGKVAAISVYVQDLDAAEKFYTAALGFRVKQRMPPELIVLEHDGPELVLCQAEKPAAGGYPRASGVVLGIPTDNLDASIRKLREQKADLVHTEPQPFPVGRFVALRDPSGNVIELLEFSR
jgi:lactoylglutathione lyase